MRFILAEAEVEIVPPEIRGHPQVRKVAREASRRPEEMLLDANHHWQAMQSLPDAKRRGRPDITHLTLLTILESPLCKAGHAEVLVHTRDGHLLRVRRDTRLPRAEARFQGLMAKVLTTGRSNEGDPLIQDLGRVEPVDVVKDAPTSIVRLDEGGAQVQPWNLSAGTAVIGAYPAGEWSEAWRLAVPEAISIWPESLNAWAVAAEIVAGQRHAMAE